MEIYINKVVLMPANELMGSLGSRCVRTTEMVTGPYYFLQCVQIRKKLKTNVCNRARLTATFRERRAMRRGGRPAWSLISLFHDCGAPDGAL